jgi:hypothetical protein
VTVASVVDAEDIVFDVAGTRYEMLILAGCRL